MKELSIMQETILRDLKRPRADRRLYAGKNPVIDRAFADLQARGLVCWVHATPGVWSFCDHWELTPKGRAT